MLMTRSEQGSSRFVIQTAAFGFAGGALVGFGLRRRGMLGSACVAVGAASIAQAVNRFRSVRREASGQAEAVIECSVSDVYRFCRQLGNLGSILPKEVMAPGPRVAGEQGIGSRILDSRENELLVWRTDQGRFQHLGRMEFHPAYYGRGTSMSLSLQRFPVGVLGAFGLQRQAEESLRRLKAVLEGHAGANLPVEEESAEETGWAPESGEPEERRFGYSRGDVSSSAGDDVGLAPESGDRIFDRGDVGRSLTEAERFEKNAQENRVAEGSEESFPASDAPSWTPGRA